MWGAERNIFRHHWMQENATASWGFPGERAEFECNWSLGQNAFTPLTLSASQPQQALCSVSRAVSLAVSQLLENSPDKSPDSCHFPPSWNGSSSSCIMLPTPQWAWHKYKTHKAFCLLVACPPLTLMSRTHLTDTADRTGQVLPTATHCAISYLSHSFQGMGSSPEQRLLFPTFCTQPGQQSFQKTELNLTANTHMLNTSHVHIPECRIICQDPRHRTAISLCLLAREAMKCSAQRALSPARLPLPGVMALTDWSWVPVAQG